MVLRDIPKLMDEPTGGLDPLMQREFFEIIRERSSQGTTVFLSSHILSEVQHNCSRAAIIREGRIIACDSVDTLAKTNAKRVSLRGTVDLTDLTGIRDQVTVDGITSFLFGGDINQLLRQLSDGNILDIHIRSLIWRKSSCIIMKRTVIEYDDCKARIKARKKFLFDMDGGNRHAACSLRVFVPGNERGNGWHQ